ncbi:type I restriction enzyme HsdR N-terminal domain-containing protein [Thermus amyloliquefaciens]|uniref:type I restriction enzyme HsdR N-terminal domain-containing protein n=1 Tax=Thermus amyloliquefaciens TaxID=1449080 RepID=UPI00056F7811|nr:type I restriction enzyme HsdR N-terminal domain-containing protein [Thermus amyloliquefaciens]
MTFSKRTIDRVITGLKRFLPVLDAAYAKDVNEADTVRIVADMLSDVFGYDKWNEITSELAIRGTYCDLAVLHKGVVKYLVEVKAIGSELKDAHLKQAVDYGANQGVEWVMLTNGRIWRVYRIVFSKPIGQELVLDIDLFNLGNRKGALTKTIQDLLLLTKEALLKGLLEQYYVQQQLSNRFVLAALLQTPPVLKTLRKLFRQLNPELKLEIEEIKDLLTAEVIKREALEGERAAMAAKLVKKLFQPKKAAKSKGAKEQPAPGENPSSDL